jgi:hypothetical protein
MPKVNLGLITTSAAASLMVPEHDFEAVSTELLYPVSGMTTGSAEVENLSDISRLENSAHGQLTMPAPGIERWGQSEKRRYKQLVVNFASSNISEAEKQELDRLEVARTRFEDERNPEEIIAEFRRRQNCSALITSLKRASL